MIRIYHADGGDSIRDQLPDSAKHLVGEASIWIDLEDPTPEEEERVFGQFLEVHPLTREDATRPRRMPDEGAHLPKVEEFLSYLLVIVNPLPGDVCRGECDGQPTREWKRPQLTAILTHHVLITHHYDALPCVDIVRRQIERRGEQVKRGPDYVFHLLLDEMVDEYAPVVERFAEQLDGIETRMFRRPSRAILTRLLRLKRQVIFLRKTLILEREVLARLVRGEFGLVSRDEVAYYRNVYDHLVRYTELIEGSREMVSDLMQTHLAAASNKLNEVMKVLTMISIVGVVCTLIAGIYGMNFKHMPELEWEYGYPFALGIMLSAAGACLVVFRWKKWL